MIRVNVAKYKHHTQQVSLLQSYLAFQEHVTMKTNSHGSCAMLLFRNPPSSQGLPPKWCFSFRVPCGSVVSQPLSAPAERSGNLCTFRMKPSSLWQCAFSFFFAAAESMAPSSALQRRAQLGLVLRLGSGLHLKLSIPDYFSFYSHLPCPSHLMWLAGR